MSGMEEPYILYSFLIGIIFFSLSCLNIDFNSSPLLLYLFFSQIKALFFLLFLNLLLSKVYIDNMSFLWRQ